jgi:quinol monooxygenase YgiN
LRDTRYDATFEEGGRMVDSTVRFVVSFAINDGAFVAFERIARVMAAETQKEPGTIAYEWFVSADRARCRLFETYVDGNAVLAHLTGPVIREVVPKLLETGSLAGFEVCGDPGPEAAKALAALGAEIFPRWLGFSR